jgi:hypothetical protein
MMNLNTRVETPRRIRVGAGQSRVARPPRVTRGHREAVEIEEKRFGYFPKRFRWHGKSYSVEAVERCWTKSRGRPMLGFRVRCAEGLFDLLQDVKANLWELSVVS